MNSAVVITEIFKEFPSQRGNHGLSFATFPPALQKDGPRPCSEKACRVLHLSLRDFAELAPDLAQLSAALSTSRNLSEP